METFFTVSAIVAIVIFGGKLLKKYFEWVTKDFRKK